MGYMQKYCIIAAQNICTLPIYLESYLNTGFLYLSQNTLCKLVALSHWISKCSLLLFISFSSCKSWLYKRNSIALVAFKPRHRRTFFTNLQSKFISQHIKLSTSFLANFNTIENVYAVPNSLSWCSAVPYYGYCYAAISLALANHRQIKNLLILAGALILIKEQSKKTTDFLYMTHCSIAQFWN